MERQRRHAQKRIQVNPGRLWTGAKQERLARMAALMKERPENMMG